MICKVSVKECQGVVCVSAFEEIDVVAKFVYYSFAWGVCVRVYLCSEAPIYLPGLFPDGCLAISKFVLALDAKSGAGADQMFLWLGPRV